MRRLLTACLLLCAAPAFAADSAEACDHHPADCNPAAEGASASAVRVEHPDAPTLGPSDAKVEVVVFSDFQCPFCRRGAQLVKSLEQKYGDKIRIVFMNQPLPFHDHARLAAAAALAAHDAGKFWKMHDWLFAHQDTLSRQTILEEAAKLGLDRRRLESDLDSGVYEARIEADQEQAKRAGVKGTPTFFINGERVQGAQPLETLSAIIDHDLGN